MTSPAFAPPTPAHLPGRAAPLGATPSPDGTNFSVWARDATGLDLCLFDRVEDARPSRVIPLGHQSHLSYHYWHSFVPGVRPGQVYGLRARGPFDPEQGLRFDPEKLLLDPYGRALAVPRTYDRQAARRKGDNAGFAMKSVVADLSRYDWEGDVHPRTPFSRSVIYEMHTRGFTRHPSSGVPEAERGTYAGLARKIAYLKDLRVTAVELMPIFQFDPDDAPPGRLNYWGYSPVSFFAPHLGYSTSGDPLRALDEVRDLVKAFHRAGIEVILDVVFNHTAEGSEDGPTQCFRGLDNRSYYLLDKNRALYANFSGCGNTLKANHPVVRRLILDSLRYWVTEMHVDGFRFDLASVLSRDEAGLPQHNPPIVWEIESDPALAGTKLIAEAWDAAGLYQVGQWVGDTWREWNGRFRDDVRSFLRGDEGTVGRFAERLTGSPDLYGSGGRGPDHGVNFVTCHDGFTAQDLVSYEHKHNEANGEGNRDGSDDNRSANFGVEGPTTDVLIDRQRLQQIKNLLTVTLLSAGVPMLSMGDEVRRTQRGNNNPYCQDNELSWLDWRDVEANADLRQFVRKLLQLRTVFEFGGDARTGGTTLAEFLRKAEIEWHGVQLGKPDWGWDSHSLAVGVAMRGLGMRMHWAINAWTAPLDFELPPTREEWRCLVDTSRYFPDDARRWDEAPSHHGLIRRVAPRSMVLLATSG